MTQVAEETPPIWAGGSGDLESNWIVGYVENISSDGSTVSLVNLIYGPPVPFETEGAIFLSNTELAGTVLTDVGIGGTLAGTAATYSANILSGSTYVLNGSLSLSDEFDISNGMFDVDGTGSTLTAEFVIDIGGNSAGTPAAFLTVSDGGSVLGTNASCDVEEGGTLIVQGAGSTLTASDLSVVGLGASMTISDGAELSVSSSVSVGQSANGPGTLAVSGSGSTLTTPELSVGWINGTGVLTVSDGASISATSLLAGEGGIGTLTISGAGTSLTSTNMYIGGNGGTGSLTISGGATVSANLFDIGVNGTGILAVSGSGSSLIAAQGTIEPGIINAGTIVASTSGDTLTIEGDTSGSGNYVIDNGATLEIGGSFAAGGTVEFNGSSGTLILDDPENFQGSIDGLTTGDQIVLADTGFWNENGVAAATIGNLDGVQTLQVVEEPAPSTDPASGDAFLLPNIPVTGAANGGDLSDDFFQVTQAPDGTDTDLTLTEGNPVAIAVNAPEAWQTYGVFGAGITIGVISSQNEGNAMADIIGDIAPDATVHIAVSDTLAEGLISAIQSLEALHCNIIVDDVAANEPASGSATDPTINAAVAAGVTYITSATNYRLSPSELIDRHEADPNALTVAAMNILAAPSSTIADYVPYITPQTEPFSSIGGVGSNKPDITGPDGGPTSFDLGSGFDPFFGTSAAAPAVAAVAALMMAENSALDNQPCAVDQLLENSATNFSDASIGVSAPAGTSSAQTEGAGLVNALGAVEAAADFTLCFCINAKILTPSGERPVQDLVIGDMVTTWHGATRRIVWIGIGKVLATRGRRNAATPVIVRKGALADNVPNRDLRVTKGHAFWLDDVLIPVEFLVNHRSIEWDDRAQEVVLYHIELETHDVLVANGAPAESYRDDGNRWLFRNANTGWSLPPLEPCAPVLTGGVVVDAVWQRLLERAGPRPGVPLTDNPDLHLLEDGERCDATAQVGEAYIFCLPAVPSTLRIVSRAAAPAELGLARDPRVLGVALRRLVLRKGTRFRVIEANDDRFTDGFYDFEGNNEFRWTDGNAAIAAELFTGFAGPLELVLHIGGTARYPADEVEQRVA